MQYTVKKPINNNIVRVVDPTGCERIVTWHKELSDEELVFLTIHLKRIRMGK